MVPEPVSSQTQAPITNATAKDAAARSSER
jgi:hypothetical protein